MKNLLIVLVLGFLTSCSSNLSKSKTITTVSEGNNRIEYASKNSRSTSVNSDIQIIFHGKNNLIRLESNNSSYYFKNRKQIIIVNGDNNKLTLRNDNVHSTSMNRSDTLIFGGSNIVEEYYVKDLISYKEGASENLFYLAKDSHPEKSISETKDSAEEIENDFTYLDLVGNTFAVDNNFELLVKRANEGDTQSQFILGALMVNGVGFKQDCSQGITFLNKSASAGNIFANSFLGDLFYEGKCVEKNTEQGTKHHKSAAEIGSEYSKERLTKRE